MRPDYRPGLGIRKALRRPMGSATMPGRCDVRSSAPRTHAPANHAGRRSPRMRTTEMPPIQARELIRRADEFADHFARRGRALRLGVLPGRRARRAGPGPAGTRRRPASRAGGLRELCRPVQVVPAHAARGTGLRSCPVERPLRPVTRHRARREADLPAGAALLLFPGPAAGPVLLVERVRVDGGCRGGDGRHPRRAAGRHAGPGRVHPLRHGTCEPATQRPAGDAEQPGLECLVPVEERRAGRRPRRALSADDACTAQRAAVASPEPLAVDPVLAA